MADNVGDAIHLNADLYDLTGQLADDYAQLALRRLWRNGWLVRQTNDSFYETKLGEGNVALELLRLHGYTLKKAQRARLRSYDWGK